MEEKKTAASGAAERLPYTVVSALLATMRLHRKHASRFVQATGLHPTQHRVLMYLSRRATPCKQHELSEHFELTPAAVAQTVDKLEAIGYVMRVMSEEDNRCKQVVLTERGREIAKESTMEFEKLDAKLLSGVPRGELDAFYRVLMQMQKNLESDLPDGKGGAQ